MLILTIRLIPQGTIISKDAIEYQGEIIIARTTRIKARSYENFKFSPLNEAVFSINEDFSPIKITELHYHPLNEDTTNDTEYEFLELKNTGETEIDLNTSGFTDGILYTFGSQSVIPPKGFVVLASNAIEFRKRYGFEPFGEFEGQLNNGGEKILFTGPLGDTLIYFEYNDKDPWPVEADGIGYSLVSKRIDPLGWPGYPSYWKISGTAHGSPGTDDIVSDVKKDEDISPVTYKLNQNYPNPFNPTTIIQYEIPAVLDVRTGNPTTTKQNETPAVLEIRTSVDLNTTGSIRFPSGRHMSLPQMHVKLIVYDILGREIKTLVNEIQEPGTYEIEFNAGELSSGVYIYRLEAGNFNAVRKMILLR